MNRNPAGQGRIPERGPGLPLVRASITQAGTGTAGSTPSSARCSRIGSGAARANASRSTSAPESFRCVGRADLAIAANATSSPRAASVLRTGGRSIPSARASVVGEHGGTMRAFTYSDATMRARRALPNMGVAAIQRRTAPSVKVFPTSLTNVTARCHRKEVGATWPVDSCRRAKFYCGSVASDQAVALSCFAIGPNCHASPALLFAAHLCARW